MNIREKGYTGDLLCHRWNLLIRHRLWGGSPSRSSNHQEAVVVLATTCNNRMGPRRLGFVQRAPTYIHATITISTPWPKKVTPSP